MNIFVFNILLLWTTLETNEWGVCVCVYFFTFFFFLHNFFSWNPRSRLSVLKCIGFWTYISTVRENLHDLLNTAVWILSHSGSILKVLFPNTLASVEILTFRVWIFCFVFIWVKNKTYSIFWTCGFMKMFYFSLGIISLLIFSSSAPYTLKLQDFQIAISHTLLHFCRGGKYIKVIKRLLCSRQIVAQIFRFLLCENLLRNTPLTSLDTV